MAWSVSDSKLGFGSMIPAIISYPRGMGYPVDESYIDNLNITHAAKLRNDAKLLLIAGGLDDIVNAASTMRLVTELNKQGKDYDFFFIPEGDHKFADNGVGYKRIVRFLREHLDPGWRKTLV
jgi:dipeptidyl aminopeptidase/acylaminoacyl peptidase